MRKSEGTAARVIGQLHKVHAIDKLREIYPVGSTVYNLLRHVSRSGARTVSVITVIDGEPTDITELVADAMGSKVNDRHGGITIGTWDNLTYGLASTLYPDGFTCNGEGKAVSWHCPDASHITGNPVSFGQLHSDGGYVLRSRWL